MKNKNNFLWFVFLCMPSFSLQAAQGSFKKEAHQKTLKMSVMTRSFLKNMINLQQEFLNQSQKCQNFNNACLQLCTAMMNMNRELYDRSEITRVGAQRLFELVGQVSHILALQKSFVGDCFFKRQALHELWSYLKSCLKMSTMMGYDADQAWLQQQMMQLDESLQTGNSVDRLVIMRCATVCSSILHQFDGVMVTDFDLVMLANFMQMLALLQC